jgi:hypothetical protein
MFSACKTVITMEEALQLRCVTKKLNGPEQAY